MEHEADPIFAAISKREELEAVHLAACQETPRQRGAKRAADAQEEACHAVCAFEREVLFKTAPTTKAGALALMSFLANNAEVIPNIREHDLCEALEACIAAIEADRVPRREAKVDKGVAIRSAALQVAAMLPADLDEARSIIGVVEDLIAWRAGKTGMN